MKRQKTKKNMKEIKEHEISNTLHWGLSLVPKTNDEIYVSIIIGKYIITLTFFLYCAKEGLVVENIKSQVATWKVVVYAKLVENATINFPVSPYRTLLFSRKQNLKFFEVA